MERKSLHTLQLVGRGYAEATRQRKPDLSDRDDRKLTVTAIQLASRLLCWGVPYATIGIKLVITPRNIFKGRLPLRVGTNEVYFLMKFGANDHSPDMFPFRYFV